MQSIHIFSRFRKQAYRWSPLTIALVACLACVALTNGRAAVPPSVTPPETPALENEFTNIVRVHIRHKETGKYLIADGDTVTCDAAEPGDQGLWEARFDGSVGLGHGGDVLFYSVATGRYLTTDAQGTLAADQSDPDASALWIVLARPLGVWIVSREFKNGYLSLDEQGQVNTWWWGSDIRSYWDIIQLDRIQ